ncbi:fructose-6-phosphate aldolase [Clostridium butyricum]|uniref:Fructose-6-phosphate aldolase n=1 Tax=Clostridium butyricum TaxID=1492 RepID=A0A6L9ESI2_CLOBU|nr:fructose-6-phosphate aldolase [Clostridium butyricum]MDU5819620.1 fructose-6-phosphate aldolase [Clostridium butyricum]NAS19339.1 fructose-6-phosphate aldolase [Clostridium butyricum]
MKFIVDDANIEKIKKAYEYYPLDGVTTNPSILAKSGRKPYEVLKEIREFIGNEAELHVQVVAKDAEGMIKDAQRITEELGKNTFIKIPSIPEGFKAMKKLKAEGFNITATAIYTSMQAFIAGKCGADYAAPYVNRIDNFGYDGVQIAKDIHDIFKKNNLKTEVLAASFKNSQQILELTRYGVGASTIAPDVIENLVKNQAVTAAVDVFVKDFENLIGEKNKTMSDC